MSAARPWDSSLRPQQREPVSDTNHSLRVCACVWSRIRADEGSLPCVLVHSSRLLDPRPCVASSCASALLGRRTNKERSRWSGAPPCAPGSGCKHIHGKHQRPGELVAAGVQSHREITLVHKAAILNSLTGLYQEANKRGSKCDTVRSACAPQTARTGADKERSATLLPT